MRVCGCRPREASPALVDHSQGSSPTRVCVFSGAVLVLLRTPCTECLAGVCVRMRPLYAHVTGTDGIG